MATLAPAAPKRRAMASPIPCPPPVTKATLPSNRKNPCSLMAVVYAGQSRNWKTPDFPLAAIKSAVDSHFGDVFLFLTQKDVSSHQIGPRRFIVERLFYARFLSPDS